MLAAYCQMPNAEKFNRKEGKNILIILSKGESTLYIRSIQVCINAEGNKVQWGTDH